MRRMEILANGTSNLRAAVSIKLMVPSIVALAQSGTEAIALSLTTALSEAAARIAMVSGSARYRRHRIAMVTNITSRSFTIYKR